jgi:hypothetical protein
MMSVLVQFPKAYHLPDREFFSCRLSQDLHSADPRALTFMRTFHDADCCFCKCSELGRSPGNYAILN